MILPILVGRLFRSCVGNASLFVRWFCLSMFCAWSFHLRDNWWGLYELSQIQMYWTRRESETCWMEVTGDVMRTVLQRFSRCSDCPVWAVIVDVWVWYICIQQQHRCSKLNVEKSMGLVRCSCPHVHVSSNVNCTITKMLFWCRTASSAPCMFLRHFLGNSAWNNSGSIPLWKHW